jgi:hypothetical protein
MRMNTIAVVACVTLLSPSIGSAQLLEVTLGPLTLLKTYIKTAGSVFFDRTAVPALTPLSVNCPVPAGLMCTVRIELASQFSTVPPDNVAAVYVRINGSGSGISPTPSIGFDSTSTSGASNVRTFSWVARVPPGDHMIELFLGLASPSEYRAGSFSRTLTVSLYK